MRLYVCTAFASNQLTRRHWREVANSSLPSAAIASAFSEFRKTPQVYGVLVDLALISLCLVKGRGTKTSHAIWMCPFFVESPSCCVVTHSTFLEACSSRYRQGLSSGMLERLPGLICLPVLQCLHVHYHRAANGDFKSCVGSEDPLKDVY